MAVPERMISPPAGEPPSDESMVPDAATVAKAVRNLRAFGGDLKTLPNPVGRPSGTEVALSGLEVAALESLERLADARTRAKAVLEDLFLRLVVHRYPVGTIVQLNQVSVLQGYAHGAARAKVLQHLKPALVLEQPECTRVQVECVTLREDGTETRNTVRITEWVLGRDYMAARESSFSPQGRLAQLIDEMQAAGVDQSASDPTRCDARTTQRHSHNR